MRREAAHRLNSFSRRRGDGPHLAHVDSSQFLGKFLRLLGRHGADPCEGAHEALPTSNLDALTLAFERDFLQDTGISVDKAPLVEGAAEALLQSGEYPRHRGAHRAPI